MRQKSDDGCPLFQLGFQLWDERQRLHRRIVQIKDNERRLLFPVLLYPLHQILVALHEFDFHVELARGLLNLRHEKQIFNERENARITVRFTSGHRFRLGLRILRAVPRALASAALMTVVATGERRAVAVIHGRRVDAIFVLAARALSGPLPPLLMLAASSATP